MRALPATASNSELAHTIFSQIIRPTLPHLTLSVSDTILEVLGQNVVIKNISTPF